MAAIDGVWETITKTPLGEQHATLILKSDGDTLTGVNDGGGNVLALESGWTDGSAARWTMRMTTPFPIKMEADVKVEGDALSGHYKVAMFGRSPITGTRRASIV